MKALPLYALLLFFCCNTALAQKNNVDSLAKAYNKNKQDTTLVQLLLEKALIVYAETNADSARICLDQSLALSRKIHYEDGEVESLAGIATSLSRRGDLPTSMKMIFDLLPKARKIHDEMVVAQCYNTLGLDYATMKDYKKATTYFIMFKNTMEKARLTYFIVVGYNNIAREYLDRDNPDSAQYYTQIAFKKAAKYHVTRDLAFLTRNLGVIQVLKGNYALGIVFFKKSIKQISNDNHYLFSEDYRRIGEAFQKLNNPDSSIYYAAKAYNEGQLDKDPELIMKSTGLLATEYKALNDYKNAYDYQQVMLKANDSLYSQQKALQIQNLTIAEQQRSEELEAEKAAYQNKVQLFTLIGILAVVILIAVILLYANRQRKKANVTLHQQNKQIESQHKALEKTLADLKSTQTQLIQSEKMASLGELTAGIAHEIQNPLNFVNNFSEVNTELIDEMQQEIGKGDLNEVKAIAANIKENQQKISQHGKRADFIVKGMLEHSRTSTGEKQPTNVNVLADEFFKLSYHGLRAKNKSFNAETITNFDENLPKINIVQQDVGRVLLNLFNNAFYAVSQKAKTAAPDYKPTVGVSTVQRNGSVIISVKDNGNGIPEAIKEKIMQPFFTTKPTGEGTGLGLSLSYDIVVKGHGGSITVDTREGEFTEFIVALPL